MVDIEHDHRDLRAITISALHLFRNTHLEEAAVKDAGEAVKISQLPGALEVARVVDGARADVSHGFQRLNVAWLKGVPIGGVQHQHAELLAEEQEWRA